MIPYVRQIHIFIVTASNTLLGNTWGRYFLMSICVSLCVDSIFVYFSLSSVRPTCHPSATAEWPWTKFSPWSRETRRRRTLNSIYTSATIHIFVSLSEVPCSLFYIIFFVFSMCCFNQSQIKRDAQEIILQRNGRWWSITKRDDEITSNSK